MPGSNGTLNVFSDDLSVRPGMCKSNLRYDGQLLKCNALNTLFKRWFSLRSTMGSQPGLGRSGLLHIAQKATCTNNSSNSFHADYYSIFFKHEICPNYQLLLNKNTNLIIYSHGLLLLYKCNINYHLTYHINYEYQKYVSLKARKILQNYSDSS